MVKRIRSCQRCGGDVVDRVHPRYGQYSECVQCGRDETTTNPGDILTSTVSRGRALPELSPIRIWQGRA